MASEQFWQARLTDGGTKIQLPDMREGVPVGNSTMGSTTARGLITHIASGLSTIAGVIGAATHVLTTGQLPKHKHENALTDPGHDHSDSRTPNSGTAGGAGSGFATGSEQTVRTGSNSTGITITNAEVGNDEAHNNVQPSVVCNWIIRVG